MIGMSDSRTGTSWGARLLLALVLIIAGAAAATWGLAHSQAAARFLGILPVQHPVMLTPKPVVMNSQAQPGPPVPPQAQGEIQDARLADLENRVARVESATAHAEGSAGRADALVIAFAARRAVDREVALGYLENLLVDRFGEQHRAAVAQVITGSHQPVRLADLVAEYDASGPELRRGGPQDSWWTNFRRELGSLVEIHSAQHPATNPEARL